jgi:hypothetical protein
MIFILFVGNVNNASYSFDYVAYSCTNGTLYIYNYYM